MEITVFKIGGSLLQYSRLGELLTYLTCEHEPYCQQTLVLIVGGGAVVEVIRQAALQFDLFEEQSHWLAIAGMSLQAELVQAIWQQWRSQQVVGKPATVPPLLASLAALQASWSEHRLGFWDLRQTLLEDGGETVPIGWQETSDSLAARAAQWLGQKPLVLVKSVGPSWQRLSWTDVQEYQKAGWLDEHFHQAAAGLDIEWINGLTMLDN